MELSYTENEASLIVQEQSLPELQATYERLQSQDFEEVQYFILPRNRIAFPIKLTTFLDFVSIELEYRN